MKNNPHYYTDLLTQFPKDCPSLFEAQIELDLPRTFPEESNFNKEPFLLPLRNILLSYSRRNSSIGYCQGFNFIVGWLLKISYTEEEAFWLLTQIVEHLLPFSYFYDFAVLLADCKIITECILSKSEAVLHCHSIKCELYFNSAIHKWLLSLFIQNDSSAIWLSIWDLFMLEGSIAFIKACVAIISFFSEEILQLSNVNAAYDYFSSDLLRKINREKLVSCLIEKDFPFSIEMLQKKRDEFLPGILEEISKNALVFESSSGKERKCNRHWPICAKDAQMKSLPQVLIFRVEKVEEFIEDYFWSGRKNWVGNSKKKDIKMDCPFRELLVERRKHFCKEGEYDEQEAETTSQNEKSVMK